MIRYNYNWLYWQDFEMLVADICRELMGLGVLKFSTNNDGGRDCRFNGTAEKYPSKKSPWVGKFVIQAKHTNYAVKQISESDFSGEIKKEIKNLKVLKEKNEVDCYLLFTNRSGSDEKISSYRVLIADGTGISKNHIELLTSEVLDMWLRDYPQIVKKYSLIDPTSPLRFYEDDLKEIIVLMSVKVEIVKKSVDKIADTLMDKTYISKEDKGKKNNLSQEYLDFIIQHSLAYFQDVKKFLGDPSNDELLEKYENTVSEINHRIQIERGNYSKFEELIDELAKLLLEEEVFRTRRKLMFVLLHFMYWNCDIGLK